MTDEVITLIFENASNENKKVSIMSVSSDPIVDYVANASKEIYSLTPSKVGLSTKDGTIVAKWSDKTVQEVIDTYNTNHFVIGTPDMLGYE